MRISIVTPSLNQKRFADAMLASLASQEYPDLEHIVCDAQSSDGSVELWLSLAEQGRLRALVGADSGQSQAINRGMKLASGEIVSWLNVDDVLAAGALGCVADAFKAHPEAVVVCGRCGLIYREGSPIKMTRFRPFDQRRLQKAFEVIQPAIFFKRAAYWQVGGLDESLSYAMDWDLLLRLCKFGKVVMIPDYLASIRYYDETKTSGGGWERMSEIANVGCRHNGFLDRNSMSFRIRSLLSSQPFLWPRTLCDHVCWNLFKDPPLMVQGWPAKR